MTNKIKILFLINDLGLGGVEKLTVNFANSMNRDEFDVSVATLFSRPTSFFGKKDFKGDVDLKIFSFKNFLDLPQWLELYKFIKKNKFGVVFTQLFMADTIGRITAFFAGTPVIVTAIQNLIPDLQARFIITNKLLRHITDACISPTSAITEYAKNTIKFPAEKIIEIPTNAVDETRFIDLKIDKKTFKESLGVPANAKMIITIGRLISQKGHTILLDAAPKVLAKEKNIYFLIVGDGRLEKELKEKTGKLGIADRVRFLGARKDTPELLAVSDIFVFPSIWEGQGLILFEAFFSKIPIVASNVGGIPDVVIDGKTGILTSPGDANDLANKLLIALENPEMSKKMANNAFEKYKNRTLANSAKKLEDLFIRLFKEKTKNKSAA
ncbi:MAG: glycosyltransferase [Patescibacteria group bacterium]